MVCGGASPGGTQSKASNPTVGLSCGTCLQMTSANNQMRPHKKHKQHHKHHHHGGGAARPSRGCGFDESMPLERRATCRKKF